MKRIITVFFVCLFSVLLMVGATTSSAAEISSSSDYFNYKATYIKDYCTYDYLVNEMRLPYRSFVETLNQDAAFQTELAAWELVNISPDLLVAQITDTKQCKYYEAIIMDLLVRDTQEASFAENMQSMKDLIHVNAWKTFINFNNEISKDTPITSENSMSLLKDMKMAGIFSDILEGADTVIDSAVNIKDLFDKLSKIETIRRMSKSYALVLDQMSNQCNDIYLTAAINNVKMFFSDNLTIDQIKSIVVLESTSSTVYTAFMENVKKMVVKSMGLTGMSVSLAQSAGTAVSNTLFGTGNMVSDYYQMSALYEIEDLLRSSLKITSGGTFCAAFKMYENICLMGCDYSKKYVEPLHTSLFGKLFSWATNQNYENYSKQLDDLKSQISFMFNMIDVGADSWYIIDTGNAQNMSDVNSFYRTSNYAKSEYTEKSESIRTNVYGTYGSNNGDDITLNGNLEIYNDFKITGGKLDLNGYKLTINGNLLQSGGEMYINGGTLEVSGDYRIQSYTKNSSTDEMEYTSSSGYLNMTKTKDLVKVKGSFFTQSSMAGFNTLEAGTMEIGGDFKQIGDSDGNFAARGTHTVIFNGTKTQHISFDSTSSYFNNLEATNYNISWSNYLYVKNLESNVNINSDEVIVRYINLNGKDVSINGDVTAVGETDINQGRLAINGNLLQSGGKMYINGGTLEVSGDYRIQSYTKNSSTDEMEYTSSSGYLNMTKTKDLVKVKGSFFTQSSMGGYNTLEAGTMKIGGDFKQIQDNSSGNFAARGTHTVIFNGTKTQHISFDSTSSYFSDVDFQNPDISFDSGIQGWTLRRDTAVNGNMELKGGTCDLNGYKLTINGNLLQSGGEMYINGGTLEVSGDYRIQSYTKNSSTDEMEYTSSSGYLNMTKTKDLVKVKGSFFTQSSMAGFNTLEAGTMEIGGDFKQIGDSDGNFAARGTHTVIFNGTKTQHISFDSTSSYFNNLEATNYNISWSNYLYVKNLESNVNINSDEVIVRYINLNGKDVSINGDVTAVGETDINQGRLAINGNLLQSGGKMYINGGTLEVSGDYRIQSYTKNSSTDEMEYTSSSGYLNMTKTKDLVKVKGSFFTQSSMGGYNTLEAGTMKIGGDFKQIQDNSSGNFAARGTHTVIFNGTKTQHISFDSTSSYFSDVDFQNPDISFDSGIQGWTLRRDTAVNGNMELKGGTCDLNGYKLTINGNLLQSGGEMYINGGTLEVSGDYRIQSYTKNSSTDEMEYTSSSGYLNMTKTKDLVKVKGSFFTQSSMGGYNKLEAGTMEIGGDFKQIGDNASYNNFAASGTHTVIFNGTKTQHISFDSTSSHFNNLKLIKDKENDYVIKPDNCWKTLYLDTCVNNVVIVSDVTSLKPKESYTMYARVDGINKPSQEVMWTVTGNTDTQTTFSENGVLTIGTNEKADKITVTAVSIEDSTKSASIDIHIEIPVPIVIGVKITPTVVSLANGDTYNFVADVYGLYSPSQNVEWTISGNQSDKTKIDVNGNLTVAKDESSNKIVVMATAVADRTKSTGVEVNIIQVKIIPTVVNVTVTNTTAIMAVGGSQTLKAIVTGSNNPSQDVTWSVSGNNSVDTVISKDGILTIAKNETTSALVVCATSVANPKKYGEFVIEISNSGDLKDLRGDVSGDGKVSIVDAVVAARYILGSVELDESQIDRTDINGDGKITLADVIMIQRIMM